MQVLSAHMDTYQLADTGLTLYCLWLKQDIFSAMKKEKKCRPVCHFVCKIFYQKYVKVTKTNLVPKHISSQVVIAE